MAQRSTRLEQWLETASHELRRRPKDGNSWMLEKQVAIIAEVVTLHRAAGSGTRH